MRKVSEIVSEYNISQDDLFDVIKKKTGAKINSTTEKIGDDIFENIKGVLETGNSKKTDG